MTTKAIATYKQPQQITCSGGILGRGPNGEPCFDDGSGSWYYTQAGGWVYSNWPSGFPNQADGANASNASNDTWVPITQVSFDYDVVFNDGTRKVLRISNFTMSPRPSGLFVPSVGNGYNLYDPVVWNTWFYVPDDFSFLNNYNTQQIQQILDAYVSKAYDAWKSRQTSFWKDALPLAVAFAAIVISAGALTQPASAATVTATDVGATATASSIPTYIAAPTLESGIPQYIAAATPGAILPVDAALGTDASILGLTGGVTAETGVYGTVENVISSAKDLYAQAKPAISTIAKLDAAYKAATIKPTVKSSQAAQPTGAPASVGALIPIGIILGLFLLSA